MEEKNSAICDDTFDTQAEIEKINKMSADEFKKYLEESEKND